MTTKTEEKEKIVKKEINLDKATLLKIRHYEKMSGIQKRFEDRIKKFKEELVKKYGTDCELIYSTWSAQEKVAVISARSKTGVNGAKLKEKYPDIFEEFSSTSFYNEVRFS